MAIIPPNTETSTALVHYDHDVAEDSHSPCPTANFANELIAAMLSQFPPNTLCASARVSKRWKSCANIIFSQIIAELNVRLRQALPLLRSVPPKADVPLVCMGPVRRESNERRRIR